MNGTNETATLLQTVPGGAELLEWFTTHVNHPPLPNFGDAELVSLHLDRKGSSTIEIEVGLGTPAIVTLVLGDWIDINISGFSHQNVMSGLTLRRAGERLVEPWELGVGIKPGQVEIELAPCFGAYGTIRATLVGVAVRERRAK